jgi:hypothetical protein
VDDGADPEGRAARVEVVLDEVVWIQLQFPADAAAEEEEEDGEFASEARFEEI